jgi:predicted enzyme related to lactoylglutathione lyase
VSLARDSVRLMAAAVLYVRDLARMRAFYERCLGLAAAEPGDGYCVLASADWDLSLVAVPPARAAAIVIADPPERRSGTPVKLAFEVPSIEALQPAVTAAGGQLDPAAAAWEFRGRRHLDCLDPEGNVVQLRQRL